MKRLLMSPMRNNSDAAPNIHPAQNNFCGAVLLCFLRQMRVHPRPSVVEIISLGEKFKLRNRHRAA